MRVRSAVRRSRSPDQRGASWRRRADGAGGDPRARGSPGCWEIPVSRAPRVANAFWPKRKRHAWKRCSGRLNAEVTGAGALCAPSPSACSAIRRASTGASAGTGTAWCWRGAPGRRCTGVRRAPGHVSTRPQITAIPGSLICSRRRPPGVSRGEGAIYWGMRETAAWSTSDCGGTVSVVPIGARAGGERPGVERRRGRLCREVTACGGCAR